MNSFFKEKLEGTNIQKMENDKSMLIELKEIFPNEEDDFNVPILFKTYAGGKFTDQIIKNVLAE